MVGRKGSPRGRRGPSGLVGVQPMEIGDNVWVEDVGSGDPGPLRTISLPIDKVLETPSLVVVVQPAPNRVGGTTINEVRKHRIWQWAPDVSSEPASIWRHGKWGGCPWNARALHGPQAHQGLDPVAEYPPLQEVACQAGQGVGLDRSVGLTLCDPGR